MTTDFILPDIGEGIVECELLEWLVQEGDVIVEDQPVAEVMTDKATVQIPAMHSGTVKKLHYKEGEIAKVHQPLFAMAIDDDNDAGVTPEEPVQTVSTVSNLEDSETEDFILPDIGEGIVECEVIKWLVGEGEAVEEDQAVIEVMTDKAVVEIPAKNSGTIVKHYYKQGDVAKVHTPLFALMSSSGSTHTSSATQTNSVKPAQSTESEPAVKPEPDTAKASGKALASPAVRRLAREQNIDLSAVPGTGKKGRVLKQDIANFKVPSDANSVSQKTSVPTQTLAQQTTVSANDKTVKVKGIQAAMARQMSESVNTIPHFTVSDDLEMSALIALRQSLKQDLANKGIKLSFMPFFIKALSLALNQFPIINSRLSDDGQELTYLADHNIGLAVDSKIGLLVPNIKRVQTKSIEEIAIELSDIIEKARLGRLGNNELTGGTISISNIGALGGTFATPVINKPEAAIVALGKTQKLPRFDQHGNVYAAQIMTVNWSGDHRIIDGATMVKFNNLWLSYLQAPSNMLLSLK